MLGQAPLQSCVQRQVTPLSYVMPDRVIQHSVQRQVTPLSYRVNKQAQLIKDTKDNQPPPIATAVVISRTLDRERRGQLESIGAGIQQTTTMSSAAPSDVEDSRLLERQRSRSSSGTPQVTPRGLAAKSRVDSASGTPLVTPRGAAAKSRVDAGRAQASPPPGRRWCAQKHEPEDLQVEEILVRLQSPCGSTRSPVTIWRGLDMERRAAMVTGAPFSSRATLPSQRMFAASASVGCAGSPLTDRRTLMVPGAREMVSLAEQSPFLAVRQSSEPSRENPLAATLQAVLENQMTIETLHCGPSASSDPPSKSSPSNKSRGTLGAETPHVAVVQDCQDATGASSNTMFSGNQISDTKDITQVVFSLDDIADGVIDPGTLSKEAVFSLDDIADGVLDPKHYAALADHCEQGQVGTRHTNALIMPQASVPVGTARQGFTPRSTLMTPRSTPVEPRCKVPDVENPRAMPPTEARIVESGTAPLFSSRNTLPAGSPRQQAKVTASPFMTRKTLPSAPSPRMQSVASTASPLVTRNATPSPSLRAQSLSVESAAPFAFHAKVSASPCMTRKALPSPSPWELAHHSRQTLPSARSQTSSGSNTIVDGSSLQPSAACNAFTVEGRANHDAQRATSPPATTGQRASTVILTPRGAAPKTVATSTARVISSVSAPVQFSYCPVASGPVPHPQLISQTRQFIYSSPFP